MVSIKLNEIYVPFKCLAISFRQLIIILTLSTEINKKFQTYIHRSSYWRCSIKNVFLKISQSLQENTRPATQVFSCELCEIFKNACFKNTTGEVLLDTQILNTEKIKRQVLIKRQVFQSFYDANTRHIQVRF